MTTHESTVGFSAASRVDRERLVRGVLRFDSLASGVLGLVSWLAAPILAVPLGPSGLFLRLIGLCLIVFATFMWIVARRDKLSTVAVGLIVIGNLAWVLATVAVVAWGVVPLTTLGIFAALAQAAAVAILAALELLGLRSASAGPSPARRD